MKLLFENRLAPVALILAIAIQPLAAQNNTAQTQTAYFPFHYRTSAEISVRGVASAVLPRSVKGSVSGAHLDLTTSRGPIVVSLGPWAMLGPNHLSITAGDEVSIAGVFAMIDGKQVLFARTVDVGGQVYCIRNEHGVALAPQARLRGSAVSLKGGAQ